jgi:hypothetical protein
MSNKTIKSFDQFMIEINDLKLYCETHINSQNNLIHQYDALLLKMDRYFQTEDGIIQRNSDKKLSEIFDDMNKIGKNKLNCNEYSDKISKTTRNYTNTKTNTLKSNKTSFNIKQKTFIKLLINETNYYIDVSEKVSSNNLKIYDETLIYVGSLIKDKIILFIDNNLVHYNVTGITCKKNHTNLYKGTDYYI